MIIDNICMLLSENFPDYEIYTENVEQGLKEPCFFVRLLNSEMESKLKSRYFKKMLFSVQVVGATIDIEELFVILEYIKDDEDNLYMLNNLKVESTEEVQTFTFNLNYFVRKELEKNNYMEDYKVKTDEKNEI